MHKYWLILIAFMALYVSCTKDEDTSTLSDTTLTTDTSNANGENPFTVNFTTINLSGYKYSPNHVLAVWVEDASNKFVNTIALYAQKRKGYLYNWNSCSGGYTNVDAFTGATLKKHQSHAFGWNLQTYKGATIVNGNYYLCIEMTSKDGQGPVFKTPFSYTGENLTVSPSDVSFLKNISILVDTTYIY